MHPTSLPSSLLPQATPHSLLSLSLHQSFFLFQFSSPPVPCSVTSPFVRLRVPKPCHQLWSRDIIRQSHEFYFIATPFLSPHSSSPHSSSPFPLLLTSSVQSLYIARLCVPDPTSFSSCNLIRMTRVATSSVKYNSVPPALQGPGPAWVVTASDCFALPLSPICSRPRHVRRTRSRRH